MEFKEFKQRLQDHFALLIASQAVLYVTNVEKDLIWETYLSSFSDDEERQGHNCNCCKQFLRPFGNIVVIENNKLRSIWDFECEEPFKDAVRLLNDMVISAPIANVFVSMVGKLGIDSNRCLGPDGTVTRWEHLSLLLPKKFVTLSHQSEEALQGGYRDSKNVLKRALDEITLDALDTTLDLIDQNSLYRGEEYKAVVSKFRELKKVYDEIPAEDKDNFCWTTSRAAGDGISKIRNTAIGTLLVDISEGKKELDHAVRAFESIMAPANYMRPTAIMTKGMIADAQAKIEELGLMDSLGRRFAVKDDITANNVLYLNRDSAATLSIFEQLGEEAAINPKKLSKVEEVTIENFISKVLPSATKIEILMEGRLSNNLMSVIAPMVAGSAPLFKWDNGFSWSYNNNVTDSIKERVVAAGGRVDGELRVSLSWFNYDDLDLHVMEPNGRKIWFNSKTSPTSGQLDVDANGGGGSTRKPVENIIWTSKSSMLEGTYMVKVNQYSLRERIDMGHVVEVECMGEVFTFEYPNTISNGETALICEFTYSKKTGITMKTANNSKTSSKEVWGISTNKFHNVSMLMHSPNYWDDKTIGNKHFFFMVDECKNPDAPRGFYNEFLNTELLAQKRVFEALGSKMKVEPSDVQLSGLGFSSTSKSTVVCRVQGSFSRVIKINF